MTTTLPFPLSNPHYPQPRRRRHQAALLAAFLTLGTTACTTLKKPEGHAVAVCDFRPAPGNRRSHSVLEDFIAPVARPTPRATWLCKGPGRKEHQITSTKYSLFSELGAAGCTAPEKVMRKIQNYHLKRYWGRPPYRQITVLVPCTNVLTAGQFSNRDFGITDEQVLRAKETLGEY